jgi:hypothetical protein
LAWRGRARAPATVLAHARGHPEHPPGRLPDAPRPRRALPAVCHPDSSTPPNQVSPQKYATYEAHPSDAASLGVPLQSHASLAAARAACGSDPACIGIKSAPADPISPWRTFGGAHWINAVGKVRATGDGINPWVPTP